MEISRLLEYAIAYLALYVTVFFLLLFIFNRERFEEKNKETDWRPGISVIIPAYNEEENISRCIRSVLDADYPRDMLEVIVVDDGSRDNTAGIARLTGDKRVFVYKKKNEGKALALNYGIERAKGEIIATLDADSFIMPDTITKMLPLFDSEDVVAVTAAIKVHEPKNTLEQLQKIEYLYTLFSRKALGFIESIHVTPGPFSLFRAWVFGKIGGFDPSNILEDQEIAMRIQSHDYRIRSSMDAEVYTEVPESLGELLKQRTRWHRGGLRNSVKYLNLIGPKYGDFGMMVMPLGFMAVIAIFAILFINVDALANRTGQLGLDLDLLLLSLRPIHIIGVTMLVLTAIWILYGLSFFKEEKLAPHVVLLYIFSYAYLLTLFWLSAIFQEIKGAKLTW